MLFFKYSVKNTQTKYEATTTTKHRLVSDFHIFSRYLFYAFCKPVFVFSWNTICVVPYWISLFTKNSTWYLISKTASFAKCTNHCESSWPMCRENLFISHLPKLFEIYLEYPWYTFRTYSIFHKYITSYIIRGQSNFLYEVCKMNSDINHVFWMMYIVLSKKEA